MKSKLFIVCLAAMLISGGCAESKPMGESSEAKEPNVILADSQIVESNIVSSNGMIQKRIFSTKVCTCSRFLSLIRTLSSPMRKLLAL